MIIIYVDLLVSQGTFWGRPAICVEAVGARYTPGPQVTTCEEHVINSLLKLFDDWSNT